MPQALHSQELPKALYISISDHDRSRRRLYRAAGATASPLDARVDALDCRDLLPFSVKNVVLGLETIILLLVLPLGQNAGLK